MTLETPCCEANAAGMCCEPFGDETIAELERWQKEGVPVQEAVRRLIEKIDRILAARTSPDLVRAAPKRS